MKTKVLQRTRCRHENCLAEERVGVSWGQTAGNGISKLVSRPPVTPCCQRSGWFDDLHYSLQARRDAAFLDEYRKQEHASLQQEGLYNVEADAEILAKQQKVTSVIKYNHQSPGNRTSFSTSAQVRCCCCSYREHPWWTATLQQCQYQHLSR